MTEVAAPGIQIPQKAEDDEEEAAEGVGAVDHSKQAAEGAKPVEGAQEHDAKDEL